MAREYLLGEMERIGLEPFEGSSYELPYELDHPNGYEPQGFTNLVGVIPGRDRSLPPILLGAHYDSVIDAPCVDDNATSVAHNLLLADHFAQEPLARDLIIAFFDAEEPPFFLGECMGSRRFCEECCGDIDFAAVIVTDLVGHDATDGGLPIPGPMKTLLPHLKNLIGVIGAKSDGTFPAIVEAAGQPFLFLSCGMGTHYHTPRDTVDWINFEKLAHITRFIEDLVVRIDRTPATASHERFDPFGTDLRMLKKALGPIATVGLRAAGIKIPNPARSWMTSWEVWWWGT